jgi:uncharacterized protein (TIGR00725 family)
MLILAESVGSAIADQGAILVCGGLGGIMEAACRGAKRKQGKTVGILPTDSIEDANAFVDIPIATGMGIARNAIIVHSCHGLIAINGRYGTLSEMAFALQKGIPLVALNSWPIDDTVPLASSAEEAVQRVMVMIQNRHLLEEKGNKPK